MARKIGFQGMRGAYSELAILQHFGKPAAKEVQALPHFEAVFQALSQARISDALLPFENSLAGTIHENYDLLARYPVKIVGETVLQIQHCLLAPKTTRLKDIKLVRSHPQALAQCRNYLTAKKWEMHSYYDTAGSAQDLAKQPEPNVAVIASEQAAKLYGLTVLARNIADRGENFTRFLHLKQLNSRTSPFKRKPLARTVSLLFLHSGEGFARIGPLCGIVQSLGIELVHCEARPTQDEAWTYNYYLELVAGPDHPSWQLALKTLSAMTRTLKVLGTYEIER